jgi:lipoprotein Spr
MIKQVCVIMSIALFFSACITKNQIDKPKKEIVISYDEYLKLLEDQNVVSKKSISKTGKELKVRKPIVTPQEYKEIITQDDSNDFLPTTKKEITQALMDFYDEWKDVKYKFGGTSKKGIDCSAFTQRVFKEKFDMDIPRSTLTQVEIGTPVKKSELKLGDLIFFKTGKVDRHVGIYMGNGKFMHASIKGIKFTRLDKPFYTKTYWTSRRVIE